MVVTPAIANLVRENKTYRIESSIQIGKKLGMQLLDDHLWELYQAEKIDLQEMLDKSRYPAALLEKAEKLHKGSTSGVSLKDDLVAMVAQKE
jgi:twitching motility protein PilT